MKRSIFVCLKTDIIWLLIISGIQRYQNYQHFEPTEEYSDKLFDFKKMIDIVQSRKNHPDQFSLNDLCIEK